MEVLHAAVYARAMLAEHAQQVDLATCDGKDYVVWQSGGRMSRPLLKAKLASVPTMSRDWKRLLKHARAAEHRYEIASSDANDAVYSVMAALTAGFDVWMPTSRKTPGTFFEILVGSLLGRVLPSLHRTAHVIIPGQVENVSTDIVFSEGARGSR
jgi:hypothetical protein